MVLSRNLFRIYFSKISPEIPSENTSRVPTEVDHMILSRICSNVSYGILKHFLQRLLQTMLQRIPFRNLFRENSKISTRNMQRFFSRIPSLKSAELLLKAYSRIPSKTSPVMFYAVSARKPEFLEKNFDGIPRDVSDRKSESRNFWKKIPFKILKNQEACMVEFLELLKKIQRNPWIKF